jgi:hypothetical protein
LHYLLHRLKLLDPEKAIFLDIPLNIKTSQELLRLEKHLPVDSYGLLLKDSTYLAKTMEFAQENNIPIHLSSVPSTTLKDIPQLKTTSIVLENWQDERLSYRLSFDGLLNFNGKKKKSFHSVAEAFETDIQEDDYSVKFLKPAKPLISGNKYKYFAAVFNHRWYSGTQLTKDFVFEWWLVKNDIFGNPLAAKHIGEGPILSVSLPEKYEQYELLLSVSRKGSDNVIQFRDRLHTPLYHPLIKKALQ